LIDYQFEDEKQKRIQFAPLQDFKETSSKFRDKLCPPHGLLQPKFRDKFTTSKMPLELWRCQKTPIKRLLVIFIEEKPILEDCPKAIFDRCFCNEDMEIQVWSQVEGVGY